MDLNELHFLQFDTIYNIVENSAQEDTLEEPQQEKLTESAPVESPAPVEVKEVAFTGDQAAKVFILVEDDKNPVLNQEDEAFLFKVMGAVKHSKSSVVLINVAGQDKALVREFLQNASPEIVIVFGVMPAYYCMKPSLSSYEAYIENNTSYFPAATLAAIQENTSQKKKLWEGLQLLFKLKKQP